MARIYNNGVGVKTRFHVSIFLGRGTSAPRQTMEPISKASHHAFDTVEQLHAWLRLNHASESELWVRIFKKATGKPSVTWDDCVVAAIAWGWIDGLRNALDDASFLQRLTPRRARSNWSQKNVQNIERLIEQGPMQAAGMEVVVPLAKLRSGVQRGEDQLKRRPFVLGMQIDRNPPAIVRHRDRIAVFVQRDRDVIGKAIDVLIDGIVHNFPHQMVQSLAVDAADIHRRPFADRLEAFENGDVFGGIGGRSHSTVLVLVMPVSVWK